MIDKPKFNLTDTLYTTMTWGTAGVDLEVKLYKCVVTGIKIDMGTQDKYWYTVSMHDITDNPHKIDFREGECDYNEVLEESLHDNIGDALTAYSMKCNKRCNEQIAVLEETMKDVDEQLTIINSKI